MQNVCALNLSKLVWAEWALMSGGIGSLVVSLPKKQRVASMTSPYPYKYKFDETNVKFVVLFPDPLR